MFGSTNELFVYFPDPFGFRDVSGSEEEFLERIADEAMEQFGAAGTGTKESLIVKLRAAWESYLAVDGTDPDDGTCRRRFWAAVEPEL
jgi:hypothetical protein